ncbi:hypothetical protein J4Q44_G00248390, partial [Coregonus suidteri]
MTKCTVGCQTDPLVMNGCRDLPEDCLLQLFESCPVWSQTCSIEKTRGGPHQHHVDMPSLSIPVNGMVSHMLASVWPATVSGNSFRILIICTNTE